MTVNNINFNDYFNHALLRKFLLKYIFGFIFICFIFTVKAKDLSLEVVSEHWPPFIIQNAEKAEDVS